MWKRRELKERAKKVLSKTYVLSFVVGIVLLIFGGSYLANSGANSSYTVRNGNNYTESYSFGDDGAIYYDSNDGLTIENGNVHRSFSPFNYGFNFLRNLFTLTILVAGFVFLILKILLGYNLTVGGFRYFLKNAEGLEEDLSSLTFGFKEGRYGNIIVTMLLRDVYIFLWTLLFVIPGVVKSYSYRMVPYILGDNPKLSPSRAIEISKEMMYGEKWNTFLLDLSFFGWEFLAMLIPFVGRAILAPYVHATEAQLYVVLTNKMINDGNISADELNLVPIVAGETIDMPVDHNQN